MMIKHVASWNDLALWKQNCHTKLMSKISHQIIFRYLVKVTKNEKNQLSCLFTFFFNSSKPVLTEKNFVDWPIRNENGILLRSDLNSAWYFLFPARFFVVWRWNVENIFRIYQEEFLDYRNNPPKEDYWDNLKNSSR